jgi:hypothetical protein
MAQMIQKNLEELNALVLNGKALEAFKKFYHPEVVMQENANTPTIGKETNLAREIEFFDNIEEFRGAGSFRNGSE